MHYTQHMLKTIGVDDTIGSSSLAGTFLNDGYRRSPEPSVLCELSEAKLPSVTNTQPLLILFEENDAN